MSLRKIYYGLSPNLRLLARKVFYFPVDLFETIFSKREKYEPKKGDIYIGSGDFIGQGNHQLDLLKKYAGIQHTHKVLDVGSGIGRTAVALTKYLNPQGQYEGFDVVEKGVVWCQEKIHTDFPNFNFQYVPLNNDLYNDTPQKATDFKFPFQDNQFDVVFLFSVFTHMQIEEIDHYLSEISRVLKPNGKCLSTFFVYNDENEAQIGQSNKFNFPVAEEGYRLMDANVKSANIAIESKKLQSMLDGKNLELSKTVEGYWKDFIDKGTENSFQDVVVLKSVDN